MGDGKLSLPDVFDAMAGVFREEPPTCLYGPAQPPLPGRDGMGWIGMGRDGTDGGAASGRKPEEGDAR